MWVQRPELTGRRCVGVSLQRSGQVALCMCAFQLSMRARSRRCADLTFATKSRVCRAVRFCNRMYGISILCHRSWNGASSGLLRQHRCPTAHSSDRASEHWLHCPRKLVNTHRASRAPPVAMLHPTGTLPNVHWRRVAEEHLQQHPEFVPLPVASSIAASNAADLRLFPQHGWQWEALHARRLTTSKVAAFVGFFEAEHASLLHVPRSMVGHDRSVEAWHHLTDADGPAGDLAGLQLLIASPPGSDDGGAAPASKHGCGHKRPLRLSEFHSLLLTAGLTPLSGDDVGRAQSTGARAGAGRGCSAGCDDAVESWSVWERVLPACMRAGKEFTSPTECDAALAEAATPAEVVIGLAGETAASTVATAPPFRFHYTPPPLVASGAGAGQPLRAPQPAFASAHEARLAWGSSQEAVGVLALVNVLLHQEGGAGAATRHAGAASERVHACASGASDARVGTSTAAAADAGAAHVPAAVVAGLAHTASSAATKSSICVESSARECAASRMYEVGLLPLEAVRSEHLEAAYGCASSQLPLIGASPDGLIIYGDGAVEVCEVKCRSPFAQTAPPALQPQGAACAGRGQRHRRRHTATAAASRQQPVSPHFCIRDDGPMEGGVTPWHVPQLQLEVLCVGPHCRGVNLISVSATKGATVYYMPRSDAYIRALLRIISLLYTNFVNPAWAGAAATTAVATRDCASAEGESSTAPADVIGGTTARTVHEAGGSSGGGRATGDAVVEPKSEDDDSCFFSSAVVQPPSWQTAHARRRGSRKGRGRKPVTDIGSGQAGGKPTAAPAPPKPRCFPAGYTAAIPGYRAFLELTLSLARRAQLRCRLSHEQVQRSPHDGSFFLDHAYSSR
jgi:hypothetical protein